MIKDGRYSTIAIVICSLLFVILFTVVKKYSLSALFSETILN